MTLVRPLDDDLKDREALSRVIRAFDGATALIRAAAQARDVIVLGGGLPDPATFPKAALADVLREALDEEHAECLQYGWPEGRESLRAIIAERMRARGADVSADDVIVTNGAQQAIALSLKLCPRAARVVVGHESYPSALQLFCMQGVRPVCEREGEGAELRYVMPAVSNPHGRGMRDRERKALLACDATVIEDDAYAELRFDGLIPRPLVADARDRVFYVGSFSKTISPGLRVGWLVPPRHAFAAAVAEKSAQDLQSNSLTQSVLQRFLASSDYEARLERLQRFYQRRAERLVLLLKKYLPEWRVEIPEGGFSVWVEVPEVGDELRFLRLAIEYGVVFDPGRMFRYDGASSPMAMRLSYSHVSSGKAEEGVKRLWRAWEAWRRRSCFPEPLRASA